MTIDIRGFSIVEWKEGLEHEIFDPVTFESELTSFCEHDSDFCTPDPVAALLLAFDLDDEFEEPPKPPHPVSDPDGQYAVRYIRFGGRGLTPIPVEKTVPYASLEEVKAAYKLSKAVIKHLLLDWDVWPMRRVGDEWVPLEEDWEEW
jgi:hypothetical protein